MWAALLFKYYFNMVKTDQIRLLIRRIGLFFCGIIALSSCGIMRWSYAGFDSEMARDNMVMLGPVSYQFYLDMGNHSMYSEERSGRSEQLITDLSVALNYPVQAFIPVEEHQREEVVSFMEKVWSTDKEDLGEMPVPEWMTETIHDADSRYGILIFAIGMTRNVLGMFKEAGQGILGSVVDVAGGATATSGSVLAYYSYIYACVIDSKSGKIVFYSRSKPQESHPLRERSVRKQLSALLEAYKNANKRILIYVD